MASASSRSAGILAALAALVVAASCRAGSEIPDRLQQILAGLGDRGGHPQASPDEIREALERQLRIAPVPDTGANRPSNPAFPTRETLVQFYAHRGRRLAWSDEAGGLLPEADTFLRALQDARRDGLDPEVYAVASIERLRGSSKTSDNGEEAAARRADLDLLLTTAFFRYASDLSTGRVHPNEIRAEWMSEPPELDLPAALDQALAARDLDRLLASLPPPHPGYARLRDALADLRKTAEAGGWPPLAAGPALKKGSRGARVAALRRRLGVRSGPLAAVSGTQATVFDARLDEAVRDFQERHGLEPDGIVAKATIAALNVPVEERIRQVELNLERWRWMPRRLGDPHVEVNVPGFELRLVHGDRSEFQSRIVAGSAFTPTPIFADRIVALVANPSWNVPRELAVREYLPELRLDPNLFLRHGIRIFEAPRADAAKDKQKKDEDLREVDPRRVKWKRMDADEFDYVLRQDPGPDNALGRMKFQLTNDFQIYLHDTPARTAFDQTSRDLSHGCIRVERAHDLAQAILGDAAPRLEEALQTTDERSIPVRPPVPIQILYLTAWVDPEKGLRFAPDVYEFDAPQQAVLERLTRVAQVRTAKPSAGK